MEKFIKVSAKEDDSHEDVPLNDDGALALSILRKYFPRAIGLKYFSEADISHEIDLDDDRFYPPLGLWGDLTQDLLRIHVKSVHGISCRRQHTPIQRSPTSKRDKRRMDDDYFYAEVKKRKYTRRKSKNGEDGEEEEEKIEPPKPIPATKLKNKCKYANSDVKQDPSDLDSSDDDVSYWDCVSENEHSSYLSKCDCVPNFNIVHYIEAKIPPEILTKFRFCKQNNIPWTGFLGYSALYKFWARIVNDNPYHNVYSSTTEVVHVLADGEGERYNEAVTEYIITEEDEDVSEATAENTNFLKSIDNLVTFN
ncbi:hypothetical protein U1Q18_050957 [Sarracenia purpurea var. burkii]